MININVILPCASLVTLSHVSNQILQMSYFSHCLDVDPIITQRKEKMKLALEMFDANEINRRRVQHNETKAKTPRTITRILTEWHIVSKIKVLQIPVV